MFLNYKTGKNSQKFHKEKQISTTLTAIHQHDIRCNTTSNHTTAKPTDAEHATAKARETCEAPSAPDSHQLRDQKCSRELRARSIKAIDNA